MRIITLDTLEKDTKNSAGLSMCIVFAAVGFIAALSPIIGLVRNYNPGGIIPTIFVAGIFGGLFGYYIGLRNVLNILSNRKMIKAGNFKIFVDEITNKSIRSQNDCRTRHFLALKYYGEAMEKSVFVDPVKYKTAKRHERCYLVFTPNERCFKGVPTLVYPGNVYEIAPELEKYLTTDIEQFVVC